jgi:hypothetical protein
VSLSAEQGALSVGDDMPDVKLASLSGGFFALSSVAKSQPLVRWL